MIGEKHVFYLQKGVLTAIINVVTDFFKYCVRLFLIFTKK